MKNVKIGIILIIMGIGGIINMIEEFNMVVLIVAIAFLIGGIYLMYSSRNMLNKEKLKEQLKIEKQKYEESVNELKLKCENEKNSYTKLVIIKDSKIIPYTIIARRIIKSKNVDKRINKTRKLVAKGFLNDDDLKALSEIYDKERDDYVKKQLEEAEIRARNMSAIQIRKEMKEERMMSNPKKSHKINKKRGIVSCPKCGSTSITMTNKKLSISRGIVGSAISPVGGVLGATTSKKMYNVCMNCGHRWKP